MHGRRYIEQMCLPDCWHGNKSPPEAIKNPAMKRPAELLDICLHFLFEFNRTSLNHSAKIKLHMVAFTGKLLCLSSAFYSFKRICIFFPDEGIIAET